MKLQPRHRVLVCGKTQHGKTTFTRELLADNARNFSRVVVFDVDGEYSPRPCKRRVSMLALAQRPELLDSKGPLAVMPVGESPEELARDVRALMLMVRRSKGTTLLVLEEPGRYSALARDIIDTASTSWAKHGVCLLFVTQRAAQVPKTSRAQLSTIVSFRQDESSDVEALRDRAGDAFSGAVVSLSVGRYRLWRDDALQPSKDQEHQLQ